MATYNEYNLNYNGTTYNTHVVRLNRDLSDSTVEISYDEYWKSVYSHYLSAPTKVGESKYAAFNGGLFTMLSLNPRIIGSCVVDHEEKTSNESYYGQGTFLTINGTDLAFTDGIYNVADAENYKYVRFYNKLHFKAASPGATVNPIGNTSTESIYNESELRTLIGLNPDYVMFISILTPINGPGICSILQQLEVTEAINMDGGGSTGFHMNNNPHSSIRSIPDALIIYNKFHTYINTTELPVRIRPAVNDKSNGTNDPAIPVHDCARITQFMGIAGDGYQWVKVDYNGIVGYCQLDTNNAYTLGGHVNNVIPNYLNATQASFRVRSAPVNGSTLAIVPQGGRATILEYLPGFKSDGYQWCKVNYNGTVGYSQIDTYNCYTVTD